MLLQECKCACLYLFFRLILSCALPTNGQRFEWTIETCLDRLFWTKNNNKKRRGNSRCSRHTKKIKSTLSCNILNKQNKKNKKVSEKKEKKKREIDGKTRGCGPLFILRLVLSFFFFLDKFLSILSFLSGQCPNDRQALSLYSSEVHCCHVHHN